jgi:uncharacterized protein
VIRSVVGFHSELSLCPVGPAGTPGQRGNFQSHRPRFQNRADWGAMRSLSRWLDARRRVVLVLAFGVAVGAAAIASRLTVKSDVSYLLPETARSVRHLRALEKRARVAATFMLGIESQDAGARQRAATALLRRLARLDPRDVGSINADDGEARRFGWDHRFLFADLADLEEARDALRGALARQNPFYVSLDDAPTPTPDSVPNGSSRPAVASPTPAGTAGSTPAESSPVLGDRVEALLHKLDDAHSKAERPSPLLSSDGTLQLVLLRTTFNGGDLDQGARMEAKLRTILDETQKEVGPDVHLGMAGDVISGIAEQNGLIHGMVVATAITIVAVLLALLLYFRAPLAVGALAWSLLVGTLATFAFARLTIGYLNTISGFLSSIVIGNGINFGIVLLARYQEERRRGLRPNRAIEEAMAGTWRGTAAAAAAAGTAYISLAVTPFRGFRDFGIIGGSGMLLCWLSAYTVLPAGLLALERRRWIRRVPEPEAVTWMGRILPRRPWGVVAVTVPLFLLVSFVSWRYLANDPMETNLDNLKSEAPELDRASEWMDKFDKKFSHGLSGGFAIGVPRRADTAPLVKKLRDVDEGKPERQRLFSQINSIDDILPDEQEQKLEVLTDIRRLIDHTAPKLGAEDRTKVLRLRPPADLHVVTDADVPAALAWPYGERDGSRGRIILANNGLGINSSDTRDIRRFAAAVGNLELSPDVLIGGAAFVFVDILNAMERDGPRATATAALGAVAVILLLLGPNRFGATTLFCGLFGTLSLLAFAAVLGLKVNVLDFVALPITIGIGIDYAVNIVSRERAEFADDATAAHGLAATATAVALCSYTTVVGYGSLLISQNRGIRSFGLCAMLGEVSCLSCALLVAPALVRAFRTKLPPRPGS